MAICPNTYRRNITTVRSENCNEEGITIMSRTYVVAGILACACALPAYARDLSALQTSVEISRQQMESVQTDYSAAKQAMEASRKNLEQARKQYADAQKKADSLQQKYQQAKARYDRAQATLDSAWKH